MPDQPHRPESVDSHDPYPRPYLEGPDPMAERRRNSRKFYDEVDAAIAAQPKAPTYITNVTTDVAGDRLRIDYDNGHATAVILEKDERGIRLTVTSDEGEATVALGVFTVDVLDKVLRDFAGIGTRVAPITGSR